QRAAQIRVNPNYASNELPHYVHVEGVRLDTTKSGVFPRLGLQFNDAGTDLSPFQVAGPYSVGGDGRHANEYLILRANVDRKVLFTTYTQEINDKLGFYLEGSMGKVSSYSEQIPFDLGNVQVMHDNFYLQQ